VETPDPRVEPALQGGICYIKYINLARRFEAYSRVRYRMYMAVSITRFRKDIFSLTEAALKGNVVEFVHKGVTFRVVPDRPIDKLSNITPLKLINPDYNLESAATELLAEMEREWEEDWSQL
jgi:hypothetical protein